MRDPSTLPSLLSALRSDDSEDCALGLVKRVMVSFEVGFRYHRVPPTRPNPLGALQEKPKQSRLAYNTT